MLKTNDYNKNYINKIIQVIHTIEATNDVDKQFCSKLYPIRKECNINDNDFSIPEYKKENRKFYYGDYCNDFEHCIYDYSEIIEREELGKYFTGVTTKFYKAGRGFRITSDFILMVYCLHNNKVNFFKFFHKINNSQYDIGRFLSSRCGDKDIIRGLDKTLFRIIYSKYIKVLKENSSDLTALINLFSLHFYRSSADVHKDRIIDINYTPQVSSDKIYVDEDSTKFFKFKDAYFIRRFHEFVKNDQLLIEIIHNKYWNLHPLEDKINNIMIREIDDIQLFETYCSIPEVMDNGKHFYLKVITKSEYVKILIKLGYKLDLEYYHNINPNFTLDTLLLLESLENFHDFLTINKELLCRSDDDNVKEYIENVL